MKDKRRGKMKRRKLWLRGILVLGLLGFSGVIISQIGSKNDELATRVEKVLAKLSLEEKVELMAGKVSVKNYAKELTKGTLWQTPENKKLSIPALKCIDGPRGVGIKGSTAFPVGMARGASWDKDLEERVGEAMGYEARAQGANVLLAPCINVLWHPSWGRAQETYGEDPYHLGIMGASFVVGAQKHVMACAKHFAVNNIEGNRFYVNAIVDERTLREIYLPHFKMCVEAGVASVMSAYNDLNGYLCAHNKQLLTDILKNDWGFKGFVVSDWVNAVEDTVSAANAGLDLEMPSPAHFGKKLVKAVQEGRVSEETINDSVRRLLRMNFKFITSDFQAGYDKGKVAGKEHADLALQVARKGIVLLKNENAVLPLKREKIKNLAVIGRLADKKNLGDIGSSNVIPPYAITPLEGIRNRAGGTIKVSYGSGSNVEGAVRLAKNVDAVVIVVGMTWKDEGEGGLSFFRGDRLDLNLHKSDEDLINRVCEVNNHCIVVLQAGSAILMESWKDKPGAILMAWYPGMEGGSAIADIIFGNVNPSGKLPIVFPKSQDQLPRFDNRAKSIVYDYYYGYRLFDKKGLEPLYPFGFGLSYTKYQYANLRLSSDKIGKNGKIVAKVEVSNIGKIPGEEVIQLYVGYQGSKVDRPIKDLKGFTRVALAPGETKTVSLELSAQDLSYWNLDKNSWEVEEIEYIVYVGGSSRNEDLLAQSFKISGK